MSKLRAAITFQHRIDEIKEIQKQKLKENIAGPITIDDSENFTNIQENQEESIEENQEERFINIQEDTLNEDEVDNESQISNWNNLIEMWNQLLIQEKEAEENATIDLNYDLDIEIDDILSDKTHPALDEEAKWNINDIFIDNLGVPFVICEK